VWPDEESERISVWGPILALSTSHTMTDPSEAGTKSTAEPLAPGNYDRAWNDPPLFSYSDSSSVQLSRPKTSLNKRVGFPSSQPLPPNQTTGSGLPPKLHDAGARPEITNLPPPPPSMCIGPPPPPRQAPPPSLPSSETPGPADHDTVMEQLRGLVESNFSDSSKQTAHNKRLSAMSAAWKEGKLSARLIGLVSQITCSLEDNDWEEAEKLLTTLSADYGGECSAWVISVRHLVNAVKQKHEGEAKLPQVTAPVLMKVDLQ